MHNFIKKYVKVIESIQIINKLGIFEMFFLYAFYFLISILFDNYFWLSYDIYKICRNFSYEERQTS